MRSSFLVALMGLGLSSSVLAADLVPTTFYSVQDDLARPSVKLQNEYDLRLGADFTEAHRYVLNPLSDNSVDSSSVRRSVNANIRLPYRFEFGLLGHDTTEATAGSVEDQFGHNGDKHAGAAVWLRNYLVQTETFSSSVTLQYEPGFSDRRSFHKASQDKTGLALSIDYSPSAYAHVGAFIGGTTRDAERYYGNRLNDELLYGARLAAGPKAAQIFVDAEARALPWTTKEGRDTNIMSQQYKAGISANWRDLNVQASILVPTTERYAGVAERGFSLSVQYVIGKGKTVAADAKAPTTLVPASNVKSQDNLEDLSTQLKDEGLQPMENLPDASTEIKNETKGVDPISTNERDEFQKWNEKIAEEQKLKGMESEVEKLEKAYAAQAAIDRKNAEAKAAADIKAQTDEAARMDAEWQAEMKGSKSDVDAELNQYTLPDSDDVNWNGLNN